MSRGHLRLPPSPFVDERETTARTSVDADRQPELERLADTWSVVARGRWRCVRSGRRCAASADGSRVAIAARRALHAWHPLLPPTQEDRQAASDRVRCIDEADYRVGAGQVNGWPTRRWRGRPTGWVVGDPVLGDALSSARCSTEWMWRTELADSGRPLTAPPASSSPYQASSWWAESNLRPAVEEKMRSRWSQRVSLNRI